MLRTGSILLVATLLPAFSTDSRAISPEQFQYSGYVNDFARVIDRESARRLEELCAEVDRKTGAQIAIVTIASLEGESIEDFTNRLAIRWGVGHKGDNRGVMILLAVSDRKYRTEVGYGLEPILPDGKVGGFGREMVPRLRERDYGGALLHLTRSIADVIARDRQVSLEGARPRSDVPGPSGAIAWIILTVFVLLIPFFVFLHRRGWELEEILAGALFGLLVTRGSGNGGNWGGGGSSGGGFGGFGGGSFGGGGASGSW